MGTTYGGNGQTTFALPDLRGRVPIHFGDGHTLGERGGEQAHTLSINELPTHAHILNASSALANATLPSQAPGNLLAQSAQQAYASPAGLVTLDPTSVTNVGGSQAHQNMQPYLALNFCIALVGIFPSQN
jgi:microcystin-dependent protein